MVGAPGVEPGTSSLSGTRSNQLSYAPRPRRGPGAPGAAVEAGGVEPPASGLQSRRSAD